MTEPRPTAELLTGPSKRAGACAVLSQRSAEPLAGTAYVGDRWLMIEHPGPWSRNAVDDVLDAELLTTIRSRADGVRLTLVRRPRTRTVTHPRTFFASTGGTPWMREIQLDSYGGLLSLDLESLARGEEPSDGTPVYDPVFFVCTHGRREICCAEFGRPVLRALEHEKIPVWEVTHIGGDRFAASMVAFPGGHYFGHLNPLTGLTAARELREGRVQLGNYRGRSGIPTSAQVAELHLRSERDLREIDAVRVVRVDEHGTEAAVTLRTEQSLHRISLESHEHPRHLLNGCGDDATLIPRRLWEPVHHDAAPIAGDFT